MSTSHTMQQRLKYNRPSLRRNARPPKQRTHLGTAFTAANLPVALALQHCCNCATVQYPPRELCRHCLEDTLLWRSTETGGALVSRLELHNSLWEYFRRRIATAPWPIASVRLDCGVIVFAHLAPATFGANTATAIPATTRVQVFSHTDSSLNAVLIAVDAQTAITTPAQRRAIAAGLGLLEPACKPGGV
ncbi:MAG TPA: zinc ribbon domain-containing protein [Kineobactrum sp.]